MFKSDGENSLAGYVKEIDAQLAVQGAKVHSNHGALREIAELLNFFEHPIHESLQKKKRE